MFNKMEINKMEYATVTIIDEKPEACLITWDYKKWCEEVTQGIPRDTWDIEVGQYIVWTWGNKKYFGQVKQKDEMLDANGEALRQWFIVSDENGKCLVEKSDVNHTMHFNN